jgi:hypothetical protein
MVGHDLINLIVAARVSSLEVLPCLAIFLRTNNLAGPACVGSYSRDAGLTGGLRLR